MKSETTANEKLITPQERIETFTDVLSNINEDDVDITELVRQVVPYIENLHEEDFDPLYERYLIERDQNKTRRLGKETKPQTKYLTTLSTVTYLLEKSPFNTPENYEKLLKLGISDITNNLAMHSQLIESIAGKQMVNTILEQAVDNMVEGPKLVNLLTDDQFNSAVARETNGVLWEVASILKLIYNREGTLHIPQKVIDNLIEELNNDIAPGDITIAALIRLETSLTETHLLKLLEKREISTNSKYAEGLTSSLQAFGELSQQTQERLASGTNGYFYNLDKIEVFNPTDSIVEAWHQIEDSVQQDVVNFSIGSWRYETVARLVELIGNEEVTTLIDTQRLIEEANDHFKNGNYSRAKAAYALAASLGSKYTDNLEYGLEDLPTTTSKNRPVKPYKNIDLKKTALDFYIKEGLKGEVDVEKHKMLNPREHDPSGLTQEPQEYRDVKDRAEEAQIVHTLETDLNGDTNWALHYLITAVASELRHQYNHVNEPSKSVSFNAGKINEMTRENIYVFFHQAAQAFNQEGWPKALGGEEWRKIAALGEMVTKSDNSLNEQQLFLFDRMLDIQHNNGQIFDKDMRIYNSPTLFEVLDLKHNAITIDEVITKALQQKLITQEEFEEYKELAKRINKLKKSPKRAKGYD